MLLGLLEAVLLLLAASFFTSGFCLTLSSLDAFVVVVLLRVARAILACAGSTSCASSSVCERLPIVEKKAGILRLGDATGGFCASTSATLSSRVGVLSSTLVSSLPSPSCEVTSTGRFRPARAERLVLEESLRSESCVIVVLQNGCRWTVSLSDHCTECLVVVPQVQDSVCPPGYFALFPKYCYSKMARSQQELMGQVDYCMLVRAARAAKMDRKAKAACMDANAAAAPAGVVLVAQVLVVPLPLTPLAPHARSHRLVLAHCRR